MLERALVRACGEFHSDSIILDSLNGGVIATKSGSTKGRTPTSGHYLAVTGPILTKLATTTGQGVLRMPAKFQADPSKDDGVTGEMPSLAGGHFEL